MQSIILYHRLGAQPFARPISTPRLVTCDGLQVFLESDEWIPVGKEGTTYYLDAGSPDEGEDMVTLVSFAPIVETTRPFHLKGTLYPGITCKVMDGAPHAA